MKKQKQKQKPKPKPKCRNCAYFKKVEMWSGEKPEPFCAKFIGVTHPEAKCEEWESNN